MKNTIFYLVILGTFSLSGFIKPEAENMGADIVEIDLPDSALIAPPVIDNNSVAAFVMYYKLDITNFAPKFVVTDGARISPAPGISQNFATPVTYTVYSEDGKWQKNYKISILLNTVSNIFAFENWVLTPGTNDCTFYKIIKEKNKNFWKPVNNTFFLAEPERKPGGEYLIRYPIYFAFKSKLKTDTY